MSKKIIQIIFASIISSVLLTFVLSLVFVLSNYGEPIDGSILVSPFLISTTLSLIVALIAAIYADKKLIKPIEELDPKSLDKDKIFPELRPLAEMISKQSYELYSKTNELLMRQNEFDSLTSNMNEGLVLINSRAMVVSCNRSAGEIFGISERKPPYDVLSLSSSVSFREAIVEALSGENGYDTLRKNDKFYSLTVSPVLHTGNVEGAVIVIIDETEKEAREALRREFTSNISHELKTPLTSISGFAELISCGMAEGEDAKRFAEKIGDESRRLVSLVGDIIRLTQLDGREIPYDDGEIGLRACALDVAEHLENVAAMRDIKISVSGDEAYILGNSTILFEMIYNLVDNAIKYNRDGGTVDVLISSTPERSSVSVRDNGIGIPKDKQDRVFERFYRVDKSHSREIGGTGLGLSIVKHSALYHGAKIELKSELDEGTEITLIFPSSSLSTVLKAQK